MKLFEWYMQYCAWTTGNLTTKPTLPDVHEPKINDADI